MTDERKHADEDLLIWTLAKIREVTGVGMKPMLTELPDAIATRIAALEAENARLREALVRLRDCDWTINDAEYDHTTDGTANFQRLKELARAALDGAE